MARRPPPLFPLSTPSATPPRPPPSSKTTIRPLTPHPISWPPELLPETNHPDRRVRDRTRLLVVVTIMPSVAMLVKDKRDSDEESPDHEGRQLAHLGAYHPAFTPHPCLWVNFKGFRDELRESNEQERPCANQKNGRDVSRGQRIAQRQDEDDASHRRQSRDEVVDGRLDT